MRSDCRGFPAQFKPWVKKGLSNRGDFEVVQYKNLTMYLWQDTKPVTVVSSNTNANDKTIVTHKQHDGSTIQIKCPQAIHNYNKLMGGVDLNDQIRNNYNYHMKSRKSYRYIFFLFHLSITNAFILTKNYSSTISIRNMKQFRQQLAMALISTYHSRKRSGCPTIFTPAIKRPTLLHFPHRRSDVHCCYYCSHHLHKRKRTMWKCEECAFTYATQTKRMTVFICIIKDYKNPQLLIMYYILAL